MPLFLLANWKWLVSASVAAILSAYAVHLVYSAKIDRMEKEQAQAVTDGYKATIAQFTADADKVHQAAEQYTTFQTNLDSRFNTITKDFANAIKARPLPASCAPDEPRMHSLLTAVAAANSAIGRGPGPAVPPSN